jgi:hypothetical protein
VSKPREIIRTFFGSGFERVYSEKIPEELADWHLYLADGGHSILCLLDGHAGSSPTFEELCPVPVKTVLRGYRFETIEDTQVPVAQSGFTYDETFGLRILDPADEEF